MTDAEIEAIVRGELVAHIRSPAAIQAGVNAVKKVLSKAGVEAAQAAQAATVHVTKPAVVGPPTEALETVDPALRATVPVSKPRAAKKKVRGKKSK